MERLRMGVESGPPDQPRQHLAVESERARLLQTEAPPGLCAHRHEHILLSAHILLRADLQAADGDNVLCAVALEPSGGKPNDEARNQYEDKPYADDASCALAQSVECHAFTTFHSLFAKAALAS